MKQSLYVGCVLKKATLIFGVLVACSIGNLWVGSVIRLPEWFSFFAHFTAGGLLTAWLIIAVWQWQDAADLRSTSFLKFFGTMIAWGAFIGVLWEFFEFWVFQCGLRNQQWLYDDTMWDLMMDLAGNAVAASWYSVPKRWREIRHSH